MLATLCDCSNSFTPLPSLTAHQHIPNCSWHHVALLPSPSAIPVWTPKEACLQPSSITGWQTAVVLDKRSSLQSTVKLSYRVVCSCLDPRWCCSSLTYALIKLQLSSFFCRGRFTNQLELDCFHRWLKFIYGLCRQAFLAWIFTYCL